MFRTQFGPVSLVVVPKDGVQETKSQCLRRPSIPTPISGSGISPRFNVWAAAFTGNLFYSYAEFSLCKEVDIWVNVKPQAVIRGTTIMFNSLGYGTGNVWANFLGPNQTRLRSEK